MPQGLKPLAKGKEKLKKHKAHAKANSKAKQTKKGNPLQLPKNIQQRQLAIDNQRITKSIGQQAERLSSARALKAGDTFSVKDIKAIGKELNRDIRRMEVTKKKSRVEEKLAELQAKMDSSA